MPGAIGLLLATQVVLWHSYRGAEQQALEQVAAKWNAAHPEIQVSPIAIPDEGFGQKLQAAIPRGHGPDAFIQRHNVLGEYARLDLVAPIDDSQIDTTQYLPATVAPLRIGEKLHGVPLAFKSPALFYRKDQLAKAPATTAEMRGFCAKRPRDGRFCLVYETGSFYYHAAWLHAFGGRIFDGGRPRLNTPAAVKSLEFLRRLVDEHVVPDEVTGTTTTELFNSGRAAMAINGPWFLGEIAPGVEFGVAPLPTLSETGLPASPLLGIEAGMVSPRAKSPAAAIQFLAFLGGPEGAAVRARVGRQTVAARAAWADPEIANDPILAAFRAQLDATVPMESSPRMNVAWEPAQLALRRLLRGAAEPEAALREADRRIDLALRPAPPEAPRGPWLAFFGALLVAGAIFAAVRARAAIAQNDRPANRAYAWIAPAVVSTLVLVFVPFAVGAGMSMFHYDGASWRFIGLSNFTNILGSRDQPITDPLSFWFTLLVTALWTLCNVAAHVGLGVALALALRDPLLKLRGVYRVLLIVPWAIPNYITALIWKGMFHKQLGAVNAILNTIGLEPVSWFGSFTTAFCANVVTNVWLGFPFMMVTTLGCLARIPKELEEAAALDGATRWQRLRTILWPLLRPALLPSVVLGAVWTFNMFNIVFLVSAGEPDGSTDILISQAYRFAFTRGHQYGYAAAYAVLIFLVLVLQNALGRRIAQPEEV